MRNWHKQALVWYARTIFFLLISICTFASDSTPGKIAGTASAARLVPLYISSFSPTSGGVGTIVTITGYGFDPKKDFNRVKFGSLSAMILAATPSKLVVVVPEGAVSSPITVTNMVNWAASKNQNPEIRYTVKSADSFIVTSAQKQKKTPETIAATQKNFVPESIHPVTVHTSLAQSGADAPIFSEANQIKPTQVDEFVLVTSTQSKLNFKPYGLACDGNSIFVSASEQNQIYKISLETGKIALFAGTGDEGSVNGAALSASFNFPIGIASDGQNLYVADSGNNLIRKIDIASRQVSTFAGSGIFGLTDGLSKDASFATPSGISIYNDSLFVTDASSHRIRQIDIKTAETKTLSGSGIAGGTDGVGIQASFNLHSGITANLNYLYIADSGNNKIRRISLSTKRVETIAGNGLPGNSDGIGHLASFNGPSAIVISDAVLFVADRLNHMIRKINLSNGTVSTVAGTGEAGNEDGISTTAMFNSPMGICASRNVLYVADTNNQRIRKLEYFARVPPQSNP